ncbi:hypothetical protein ACFLUC_03380 [Chloroflexota bacterium]
MHSLAVIGDDLYVGGGFSKTADGVVTDLYSIARYDLTTGTWHALPNQGLDGNITVLASSGNSLYVAGYFPKTGDGSVTGLGNIARLDTMSEEKNFLWLPSLTR